MPVASYAWHSPAVPRVSRGPTAARPALPDWQGSQSNINRG